MTQGELIARYNMALEAALVAVKMGANGTALAILTKALEVK